MGDPREDDRHSDPRDFDRRWRSSNLSNPWSRYFMVGHGEDKERDCRVAEAYYVCAGRFCFSYFPLGHTQGSAGPVSVAIRYTFVNVLQPNRDRAAISRQPPKST